MKKGLLVLVAILVVIGIYLVSVYNGLIGMNENVDNKWAQVQTQYQRRFDLIPNLVSSVEGIMTQEREVFGDLAEARANYSGARTANEQAAAASQVEGALGRLLVIMENYPQLNSSQTVQSLMVELAGTENRIGIARKDYNDVVTVFNRKVKTFPTNIMAGMFGFDERTYFEAADNAQTAPQVNINVNTN